jgi:sulfur-oxidizing protein SoxY
MNLLRRKFVKTAAFVGATVTVGSSALLMPQRAIGAYAKAAFEAKDVDSAIRESLGSDQRSASSAVKIKAPDIAENGAVVPVTVSADMANVTAISIVAASNASPLTSVYMLGSTTEAFVSTRIKMAKTAIVTAVVKADGKLYSAEKEVKVTIGGCGG